VNMSAPLYTFTQEDGDNSLPFQTDEASTGEHVSFFSERFQVCNYREAGEDFAFFWQRVQLPQYHAVVGVPSDVRETALALSEGMAYIQTESLQFLDQF
jgi:hypothetical protein